MPPRLKSTKEVFYAANIQANVANIDVGKPKTRINNFLLQTITNVYS